MTKLSDLQPFKEPPPVEKESCHACRAFAPECLVPVGEGAVPMCWLCAHHAIEHGADPSAAACAECECTPGEIYPHRHFDPPGDMLAREPAPEAVQEKTIREIAREKLLRDPKKLAAWADAAHKQMSMAQHAAVQRKLTKSRAS